MIVSIHRWTRVSSFHEFITPFPFQTTKQHFSRPSSSNIRKKKKKNILSSKFKLENLRKIVNRGTFRKKSIVFHETERTIYNLRDGRLDQEMRRCWSQIQTFVRVLCTSDDARFIEFCGKVSHCLTIHQMKP